MRTLAGYMTRVQRFLGRAGAFVEVAAVGMCSNVNTSGRVLRRTKLSRLHRSIVELVEYILSLLLLLSVVLFLVFLV